MKISEMPTVLKEALALYESYRQMGFEPKEIFASYNKDSGLMMGVETQGKQGYIRVGSLGGMGKDEFLALWKAACECINVTASQGEVDLLYRESIASGKFEHVAMLLMNAGLVVPNLTKLLMAKAGKQSQLEN